MANTETTLTWLLKDEVSGKAKDIDKALDSAGTTAGRSGGLLGGLGGSLMAMVNPATLAVAGVGALTAGLIGAIGAAKEEQVNIEKMNTALQASVPGFDGNTDAIEDLIAQRENLSFSDDELRSSFAALVTSTGDVQQATDLQATAMDLARLKGVDLQTASEALAKANVGSTKELKALGIEVDEGASKTEVFAAIQAAAAGQAEAYAGTTEGKWNTLQNKIGDLVEDVGSALLPIMNDLMDFVIDTILPALEDFADAVGPVLKVAFKIIGDYITWWIDNIIKPLINFISTIISAVQTAVSWFQTLTGTADKSKGSTSGAVPKSGGRPPGRAVGGPVDPYGTYLVGERGPELLQMGGRGGSVIPGGGYGGVPVEIALKIDGDEIARVVDRRLYLAVQAVGGSYRPR